MQRSGNSPLPPIRTTPDDVSVIQTHIEKLRNLENWQDSSKNVLPFFVRLFYDKTFSKTRKAYMYQNGFGDAFVKYLNHVKDPSRIFEKSQQLEASKAIFSVLSMGHNLTNVDELAPGFVEGGFLDSFKDIHTNDKLRSYLWTYTKKEGKTISSTLGMVNNIARLCPQYHELFREKGIDAILIKYATDNKEFVCLKFSSICALVSIMTEEQMSKIETDLDFIEFTVKGLEKALASDSRTYAPVAGYNNYTADEYANVLKGLATNENYIMKIIEAGALPLLTKMIMTGNETEQKAASATIWNLSFKEEAQKLIKEEKDLLTALTRVRSATSLKELKRNCDGVLWKLNKADDEVTKPSRQDEGESHIMISYNWSHQKYLLEIKDRLKAAGKRVWMDVEDISGSTLESMATAVEQANVVLIAISEEYKRSAACRTEAEYAFQLRKPMIPLMMQRRYKPDGWLGILLGSKLYIDMNEKYTLDKAFTMLLKELGKFEGVAGLEQQITVSAPSATFSSPSSSSSPSRNQVRKWSKSDVTNWFDRNGFGDMKNGFALVDGCALNTLVNLRHENADCLVNILLQHFKLDIVGALRLMDGLEQL